MMKVSSSLLKPNGLIAVFVISAFAASCQTYTKGLEQSQARADETVAIMNLRAIASAQQAHAMSNEGKFATFPQLVEAGLLDSRFEGPEPEMNGYAFKMDASEKGFSCQASPLPATSGRHYYVDSSSPLIRVNASRPATADDPAFQP